MSVNKERWELAQEYELNWWKDKADKVDLEFYERFANDITNEISSYYKITTDSRILEIGSGAAGTITYFDSNFKYAIDPLEDFYVTIKSYRAIRDSRVIYKNAMAENLPFESDFFDLIVIDNVLDHCQNPEAVLSEMNRVLKTGGIVYFRQNTYHCWGKFIRTVMEFLKIDAGHPHTFRTSYLHKAFKKSRLSVMSFKGTGYLKTWLKEIRSKRILDKVKAVLLATRNKTTFILKK